MTEALLQYVCLVPGSKNLFSLCLNPQEKKQTTAYLTEPGSLEDSLNWLNLSPHRSRKPPHFNEQRLQGEPLYLFNLTEKVLRRLTRMRTECWTTFVAGPNPSCLKCLPIQIQGPSVQRWFVCFAACLCPGLCVWVCVCAYVCVCTSLYCSPGKAQSQTWHLLEEMTEEGMYYKGQGGNKAKSQTEWVRKLKNASRQHWDKD